MKAADEEKKQLVKIRNETNKIKSGEDLKRAMEIFVDPNASWEEFLVHTPLVICLLGELVIISAFSLYQTHQRTNFSNKNYQTPFVHV